MEEYKVENSEVIKTQRMIKQDRYYKKVYNKHVDSYGDYGADNIRDNIMSTFGEALDQYDDDNFNNNMLLVGNVDELIVV